MVANICDAMTDFVASSEVIFAQRKGSSASSEEKARLEVEIFAREMRLDVLLLRDFLGHEKFL